MATITIRLLKPYYLDAPFVDQAGTPTQSATLDAGTEIVGRFGPPIADRNGKRQFNSAYGTDYFAPDDFEEVPPPVEASRRAELTRLPQRRGLRSAAAIVASPVRDDTTLKSGRMLKDVITHRDGCRVVRIRELFLGRPKENWGTISHLCYLLL